MILSVTLDEAVASMDSVEESGSEFDADASIEGDNVCVYVMVRVGGGVTVGDTEDENENENVGVDVSVRVGGGVTVRLTEADPDIETVGVGGSVSVSVFE
jgi:hypothetical protein